MAASSRADLAAAISVRNAAAKEVDVAERALIECVGTPFSNLAREKESGGTHRALKTRLYEAQDRCKALERESREILARHNGNDLAVARHFVSAYAGKTAGEMIDEAKAAETAATRELAIMEVERGALVECIAQKERELRDATVVVNDLVSAILQDRVMELADDISADTVAIYRKVGALKFLTLGMRESEGAYKAAAKMLTFYNGLQRIADALLSSQDCWPFLQAKQEGELVGQSAYNKLSVDASAPLPSLGRRA